MPVGPISRSIAKNSNALLGQAPTPQSVGFVGGNSPGVFNAFDYPDLVSWVDANSICANVGDPVRAVLDQAVNTKFYDAVGTFPKFGYVSGRPAIVWDGIVNGLSLQGGLGSFPAPWTIVTVCQNLQNTDDAGLHCVWAISGSFVHMLEIDMGAANQWQIQVDPSTFDTTVNFLDTNRRIWVTQVTGTTVTVRSNGVQLVNQAVTPNTPTGAMIIGSRNGVDRPWLGSIQEHLVFRGTNLMPLTTVQQLERALGKKWSITIP